MNKYINIKSARFAFFASLFIAAAILAFLAPKAAVNVDEQLHYPHAQKVVNWYFTGGEDTSCLETPFTNLKYYGQSVDNFTALINRVFLFENEFLIRHYTGAFFFWFILLFSGLIGFEISKSFWVSTITVISLLIMPRLFGHAFGNLKDIPFAAGYVAGIYFIIHFFKEMPKPRWSTVIWLGLTVAFTCSVRIGGLILLAYLALFSIVYFVLKPFVPKQNVSTKPCLVRLLGQGTVIVIIGYFAGLLFWPFALQDVFRNPLESLQLMEHYKVSIRQIFDGNMFWSTELPWYYLPKWFLISTPEFVFLGLIFYLIYFTKNIFHKKTKQLFYELFLIFALLFPIIYVIAIDANLYSGIRQMLFVVPLFAILGSVGLFSVFQMAKIRIAKISIIILFIGLSFLPVQHQAATFPADYIYFNSISGGNNNAWGNYEYDYYFHGFKEPAEYLINLVCKENITIAANCNLSNYFENSENIKYNYTLYLERSSADWDYGLFGINYIHPDLLKNGKWYSNNIEKVFFHGENPIAVLLKRNNKADYEGIEMLNSGILEEAKYLLDSAITGDKNNVWLLAQLANISLKQNDFKSFNRYLQSGKEIYPSYEPLFLLEAQRFYSMGNYIKSKEVLDNLVKVNSRYMPAEPLWKVLKEKLNK